MYFAVFLNIYSFKHNSHPLYISYSNNFKQFSRVNFSQTNWSTLLRWSRQRPPWWGARHLPSRSWASPSPARSRVDPPGASSSRWHRPVSMEGGMVPAEKTHESWVGMMKVPSYGKRWKNRICRNVQKTTYNRGTSSIFLGL